MSLATNTTVKREYKTDYLGGYLLVTFADGHQETQPPNRPMSKEDVQRQIRQEEAKKFALKVLAAERSRFTTTTTSNDLLREQFDVLTGRTITEAFSDGLDAIGTVANTCATKAAQAEVVMGTIHLGAPVVGARAGERTEYTTQTSTVSNYAADSYSAQERTILERTRESVSN